MPSKAKQKKSSSQKFSFEERSHKGFKKKFTSPSNFMCKLKSKVSSKRQTSPQSNLKITPSFVQRNYSKLYNQSTLTPQLSIPSLRSKRGSQVSIPGSSKLPKKKTKQKIYTITGSDYLGSDIKKLKNYLKWVNKNHAGSTFDNQICYEYGYSELSHPKSNIKKSQNASKNKKKYPEESQIQRLLAKYTKDINNSNEQFSSTKKTQDFGTLSTDDKSQKKFEFTKKYLDHHKDNSTSNKFIKVVSPSQKHQSKSKKKSLKVYRKKTSSKTLLPEYFGCLSINRVESKIQTKKETKQKDQKNSAKKTKKSTSKISRVQIHKKSQQNLQTTKVKQEGSSLKEIRQFCDKDTKKCHSLKQMNSERSTISPSKKCSQQAAKIISQKRSRKLSKKQIKPCIVMN